MPLIKPSLIVITMLLAIWDFNVFNQIWLVSQGGPVTMNRATANHGVRTISVKWPDAAHAISGPNETQNNP